MSLDQDEMPVAKILEILQKTFGAIATESLRRLITRGFDLTGPNATCNAEQLREVLDYIFGPDTAELLMQKILKEMKSKNL